jgi:tRNA-dihydrouridine synthase B
MAHCLPWLAGPRLPLYLAPMAGFTDVVFRQICKEHGADVMVTEFVMADKFLHERSEHKAWEIVDFTADQRPMGVQIFGGNPANMAEAARRIVDRLQPDFIDINFGCPAPKVVNNCAGSSLLRDLPLMGRIAAAMVGAVGDRVPVTAKMRIGWNHQEIVAVDAAQVLVASGIAAIAIHGRTKEQGYSGEADWEVIHAVADAVPVPVIGNGSVRCGDDAVRIRQAAKVRGLMIGRAALGNPWLFSELRCALDGLPPPPAVSAAERRAVVLRYCRDLLARPAQTVHGDSISWLRPRLQAFAQQFPGSRALRHQLGQVRSYDDLLAVPFPAGPAV